MREIKFRVWSKPSNKMYQQLNESPCFGLFEGDRAVSIEDVFFYEKQDFEVMQYTGLKDKNGKEIYEGDIIQYKDSINNGLRDIEVIRNAEVSFGLGMFWGGYGYNLASIRKEAEIIGNIYENPELLEEAQ